MSMNKYTTHWMAAVALSVLSGQAVAGISLDRTRLIITEKEASASVNLSNTSSAIPFLAQSWVEDEKGNKIAAPLLVLPPLQRKRRAKGNCARHKDLGNRAAAQGQGESVLPQRA